MRYARLTVQHSAAFTQFPHHLALADFLFACPRLALERPDPAHIPHSCLNVFDVELVFEADGKAVEGSDRGLVFGVVGVEGAGVCDGGVEEDFVEAVELYQPISKAISLVPFPLILSMTFITQQQD